jgi:hypothetical protein
MPEISKMLVSIRFSGTNMDPKQIAELLGFIPSEITEISVKTRQRTTIWSIRLKNGDPLPLDRKIETLLNQFTEDIGKWQKVFTENIYADIFCGLFLDEWNEGTSLPPSLLKKLSDRNLEIDLDIYSPTNSPE